VEINGQAAPLLLASAEQINFQCPQSAPGTALQILLTTEDGETRPVVNSTMSAAAPAIFTMEGTDQAVVQVASTGETVGVTDPASGESGPVRPGEFLRIYAIGLGETDGELAPGMPAPPDEPIRLRNRVTVFLGDHEVEPLFVGLAPGSVGVFRLELQVPEGVEGTDVPLFLRVELTNGTSILSQQTWVAVDSESTGAVIAAARRR
jgi:uncharacterized protein (TIGR03437 family)